MITRKLISVLDIGSKKISVFIGAKGVNDIFIVKAKSEIDYEGYADGKWLDYKNLGSVIYRAIKQAEQLSGIKIKKIYLGVPGEFTSVITKELTLSYNSPHTVTASDLDKLYSEGNVYDKNSKCIAINSAPIFYTLDNSTRLVDPTGSKVQEITGLLSFVLATRDFYQYMSKLLLKIEIKEIEFISVSWAEGMYLFDDETRDKYVLLVDVGYLSTCVSLFRGDGLLYQRSFSLGGGHIDADLFRVLNVSYEQAVNMRKSSNLSLQAGDSDTMEIVSNNKREQVAVSYIQSIISARILDIAETIKDCIDDCEYDCPQYIPIHLTGGGIALINGAKVIIQEATKRNVEIIAPNVPDHSKPQYSSVFGIMHIASRLNNNSSGIKKIINRLFRL